MPKNKLSQMQKLALANLNDGKWHSAYSLRISRRVLDSLVRYGLAESVNRPGSMFFPRTNIEYRLIPHYAIAGNRLTRKRNEK